MNIAKNTFQQGDVTGKRLSSLPEGNIEKISKGKCVLALGEKTGHCHVVEESDAELIRIGERMILKLENDATLVHQEHGPIGLTPGLWEIDIINEYDYFTEMARKVQD